MHTPKLRGLALALVGFSLGIGTSYFGPRLLDRLPFPGSARYHRAEEMRVTSPTGNLDAVIVRQAWGGAAGGFEWRVFIVPKGKPAPSDDSHALFEAGTLAGEKLVWNQPHLLEIHFDVAEIEQFRNYWGLYEVQDVGSTGEHNYGVEIRLVPASPDFSLMTPEGGFRREY